MHTITAHHLWIQFSIQFPPMSSLTSTQTLPSYYRHELTLSNGFQALRSVAEIDHATLMMNSMIKRKALPQKGNLLLAVLEAGPLLQTLLLANPLPVARTFHRCSH
ncbi:unnamed protein product [Lactuca virosa]|uniref:Uncharacterized protein n=1 Tax=Lactuca virosa TaxID=75947 RepID=A0AAU9NM72_9ASTR|nr:unnamed protein product [Lactuca virosa]